MKKESIVTATVILNIIGISSAKTISTLDETQGKRAQAYSYSQGEPDYRNAKPMPLPQANINPTYLNLDPLNMQSRFTGKAGSSRGHRGSGVLAPERGIKEKAPTISNNETIAPREHGTLQHPFTTARVDGYNKNSLLYPFRPTGKLYFVKNGESYVCSASLIKKGVLVTAAHCVWEKGGGSRGRYSSFRFEPAKYNSSLPFGGSWTAYSPRVLSSWKQNSENYPRNDDIAVLKIAKKPINGRKIFPGELTGYYSYGWNGYGFTDQNNDRLGQNLTQITQLGYPVSHDRGWKMQRTDSLGYINSSMNNNTIIGSRQTGGASGGPWLVNFGSGSTLNGTSYGYNPRRNTIVGVSSWGFNGDGPKVMGATQFTSNNIVPLVRSICNNYSGC